MWSEPSFENSEAKLVPPAPPDELEVRTTRFANHLQLLAGRRGRSSMQQRLQNYNN